MREGIASRGRILAATGLGCGGGRTDQRSILASVAGYACCAGHGQQATPAASGCEPRGPPTPLSRTSESLASSILAGADQLRLEPWHGLGQRPMTAAAPALQGCWSTQPRTLEPFGLCAVPGCAAPGLHRGGAPYQPAPGMQPAVPPNLQAASLVAAGQGTCGQGRRQAAAERPTARARVWGVSRRLTGRAPGQGNPLPMAPS